MNEDTSTSVETDQRRSPLRVLQLFRNALAHEVFWYAGIVVAILLACPILVFVPLFLSGIEYSLFGTSHVEDFFQLIQLHDELNQIYTPVIDFIQYVLN